MRILGAEVKLMENWRPAFDQRIVTTRVGDLLEACCDEWLNGTGPEGEWQDGSLLPGFCESPHGAMPLSAPPTSAVVLTSARDKDRGAPDRLDEVVGPLVPVHAATLGG